MSHVTAISKQARGACLQPSLAGMAPWLWLTVCQRKRLCPKLQVTSLTEEICAGLRRTSLGSWKMVFWQIFQKKAMPAELCALPLLSKIDSPWSACWIGAELLIYPLPAIKVLIRDRVRSYHAESTISGPAVFAYVCCFPHFLNNLLIFFFFFFQFRKLNFHFSLGLFTSALRWCNFGPFQSRVLLCCRKPLRKLLRKPAGGRWADRPHGAAHIGTEGQILFVKKHPFTSYHIPELLSRNSGLSSWWWLQLALAGTQFQQKISKGRSLGPKSMEFLSFLA